jgi:hypothetical protein
MDSGHCKDCKHFDVDGSVKANWGICDMGYAYGYDPHNESAVAFAAGEGDGELYVKAEFGCVQFEAKEQG